MCQLRQRKRCWLNGQSGRSYTPPEGDENANQNSTRTPNLRNGAKVEDPLQANQGFESPKPDGGQNWRPIYRSVQNRSLGLVR